MTADEMFRNLGYTKMPLQLLGTGYVNESKSVIVLHKPFFGPVEIAVTDNDGDTVIVRSEIVKAVAKLLEEMEAGNGMD